MQKAWTPPLRWVLGAATILGLFSTLQAYRLTTLNIKPPDIYFRDLLFLNLAYWYVPALLTPTFFRLAHRLRQRPDHWLLTLGVHAIAAGVFSVVHFACLMGVRLAMWPGAGKMPTVEWTAFAQRMYLTNLDWALMTYSAIIGLSYALAYYQESQERALKAAHLETRLAEARLRTLEAELHPHFLFNTLHAISALMHRDVEAADRTLMRLSDLLRMTLENIGQQEVTLIAELDFLSKYLQIEQTRFADRLMVRYDIQPDALDVLVPSLVLQPLVENAIKHGVARKAGRGHIDISARREGDKLRLEVRDDGVGLSEDALTALQKGIGVSTTRARLQHLFGADYRFEFHRQPEGLTVLVGIPWRAAADHAPHDASAPPADEPHAVAGLRSLGKMGAMVRQHP
jgi:signal transduction histidine kinase